MQSVELRQETAWEPSKLPEIGLVTMFHALAADPAVAAATMTAAATTEAIGNRANLQGRLDAGCVSLICLPPSAARGGG
jgi:hypothetical protein